MPSSPPPSTSCPAAACVDVLPGTLVWAPEVPQPEARYAGAHVFRLADARGDDHLRGGVYQVPHYPSEAYGRAFGPLGLDQVMQFCHVLGERIATYGRVVLATEPADLPGHANAAVLLGAYLMLRKDWSLAQVRAVLKEEDSVGFPCSWWKRNSAGQVQACSPSQASCEAVMQVGDCWAGLDVARKYKWIADDAILSDPTLTSLACSQYRRQALQYDACWLEPGAVLVCADPTTTIRDPNPYTCSSLVPRSTLGVQSAAEAKPARIAERPQLMSAAVKQGKFEAKGPMLRIPSTRFVQDGASDSEKTPSEAHFSQCGSDSEASSAPTRCLGPTPAHEEKEAHVVSDPRGTPEGSGESDSGRMAFERQESPPAGAYNDSSSCHTVCKMQVGGEAQLDAPAVEKARGAPKDFLTFCDECGVGTILRVNRGNEAGIHEYGGSYDPKVFRRHGIQQLDIPVDDKLGGLPSAADIAEAMRRCESYEGRRERKAVLVHCKGGFGRSVVFAACRMMWEHDIPGRALLGWVRVVRPGAICTPDQERFLCKLGGRGDLQRHIAAHSGHHACCTIS